MNTKTLATTIVFAALTVALNPTISGIGVPAPYAPFLIYGLWEIPIVAAFILINPASGIMITIVNAAVLFAFYPGTLPTGPLYNFIAILSTLLGVYIAQRIFTRSATLEHKTLKIAGVSTVLAIILRIATMSVVNYATLGQPYPIGFGLPEIEIIAFLPLAALFNGTLAAYTVPMGEFIAEAVKTRLKLK